MKIKKTAFLITFLVLCMQGFCQSPNLGTITLFAEEGENFTLFINGEKINATPAPKVLAENVTEIFVSIRVVFEDAAIPAIKKNSMRGAKDCTYMLQKNKKGEYNVKVKSCSNPFPQATGPAPVESIAPTSASSGSAPAQYTATYSDGTITVNNGRTYTVTKTQTSGFPMPHVIMNAPVGAKITITYDDNNEKYVTEVPFDYEVKDYNNNNSYFRLTVDEGGPEKTWYVRLQNGNGYKLTIE